MKGKGFKNFIQVGISIFVAYILSPVSASGGSSFDVPDYDSRGHRLARLWSRFDDLERRALPTDCLDVLEMIKIEAAKNGYPLDFYDACRKSLQIGQTRDWKAYDRYLERFRQEIEASPDLRVRLLYLDEYDRDSLGAFIADNADALSASFDAAIREYLGDRVKINCIQNDYQFALWLASDYDALGREYSGNATKNDIVEFYRLRSDYTIPYEKRKEIMQSRRYLPGAVSLLYTEYLLSDGYFRARLNDSELGRTYRECVEALEKQTMLEGEDDLIFKGFSGLQEMREQIGKAEVVSRIRSNESISYVLKNLNGIEVSVRGEKVGVTEKRFSSRKEFPFVDTLVVDLSPFDDGSYELETSTGQKDYFDKHTLYLNIVPTDGGGINRVFDLRTGEAVDIFSVHEDRKKALRWVTVESGGITRASRKESIPEKKNRKSPEFGQLKIITGAGAFHPGDTLHFKVIGGSIGSGTYPKGTKVDVGLRKGKEELESISLKLGDFGSAESFFLLPEGEEAVQYYTIHASFGEVTTAHTVKVDNFSLPAFTFDFDPLRGLPEAGGMLTVTGKLKSYSGHKIGKARLSASRGDVSMDAEGNVSITLLLDKTDYQSVVLSITDDTGETHEFRKSIVLRPFCSVENVSLQDGFLSFTPSVRNSDGVPVEGRVDLVFKDGERLLHSGTYSANTLHKVYLGVESLSLVMESGNYPLLFHATVVSDEAHTLSESIDFIFEKTPEGVRFGSGTKPLYMEYYLTDGRGLLIGDIHAVRLDDCHQIEYVDIPKTENGLAFHLLYEGTHRFLSFSESAEQTAALSVTLPSSRVSIRERVKASIISQPGMECVAVVYDKTLDEIFSARPEAFRHDDIPLLRSKVFAMAANGAEMEDSAMMEPVIRSDFSEIIAFEPFIMTDSHGRAEFSFQTSDRTGSYTVLVFAHDRSLSSAVATTELTVFQPVQISMSLPSTFVEGDRFIPSLNISNAGAKDVRGDLSIRLIDGNYVQGKVIAYTTRKSVSVRAGSAVAPQIPAFEIPKCVSDTLGLLVGYGAHDAVFLSVPLQSRMRTLISAKSQVLLSGTPLPPIPPVGTKAELQTAREIVSADLKAISRGEEDAISLSAALVALPSEKVTSLLSKLQTEEGGFAWIQGLKASAMITAIVLERFSIAEKLHHLPDKLHAAILPALRYLDIDQNGASPLPVDQYLYVRGLYSGIDTGVIMGMEFEGRKQKFLQSSVGLDVPGVIWLRARHAEILLMYGMDASADIASLKQFAVEHQSGGIYFPGAVVPFRGLLESEIYAHAHICRLFSSLGDDSRSQEIARGLRTWLIVQRQTQQWSDNPSYIDALAVVMEDDALLDELRIYTESTVLNQFFDEVKPDGNGMSISRKWYKVLSDLGREELTSSSVLSPGDKVEAEITLYSTENRSLVTVSLPHPACLSPVNGLSGYAAGAIRMMLSGQIKYWYEVLPEEKTVIREQYYVTSRGTYAALFPEVICNYASAFRANGESSVLDL